MKRWLAFYLTILALLGATALNRPALLECRATLDPEGHSPLSARFELLSRWPLKVERVVIKGVRVDNLSGSTYRRRHSFPITGLLPGRTNTVFLELSNQAGRRVQTPEFQLTTAPLPEDVPKISTGQFQPRSSGLFLCTLSTLESPGKTYQLMLDSLGNIVWLRDRPGNALFTRMLPNGLLATLSSDSGDVTLEDLNGYKLASHSFGMSPLNPRLQLEEASHTLWALSRQVPGQRLLGMSLETGEVKSLPLGNLWTEKRELPIFSFSPGRSKSRFLLALAGQNSVAELETEPSKIEWVFGPPPAWSQEATPWLLSPSQLEEVPEVPTQTFWAQNGGLITVESSPTQVLVREYLVDLRSRTVTRNWSRSLPGTENRIFRVDLNESPYRPGVLLAGFSYATRDPSQIFARIQQFSQSEEAELTTDLILHASGSKNWKLESVQEIQTPYSPR